VVGLDGFEDDLCRFDCVRMRLSNEIARVFSGIADERDRLFPSGTLWFSTQLLRWLMFNVVTMVDVMIQC
jgi:hypothetical protein